MELSQLRDLVEWQEKKAQDHTAKRAAAAGREAEEATKLAAAMPHIRGLLNEFVRWRRRRLVERGLLPKEWLLD